MSTAEVIDRLSIRLARPADIPAMQAVEIDAAQRYMTRQGYEFCAALPSRTLAEHLQTQQNGVALVAVFEGAVVGFLLGVPIDRRAHVLEAATERRLQGRGVGRRLFSEFHQWAADGRHAAATLTTYRDIPWNAPFYERLGYRAIVLDGQRTELAAVMHEEAISGFARKPRVAMERSLAA